MFYAFSHKNNYTFTAAQTRKFLLSPICTSGGVPGFVPLLTSTAGPIEVDYYVNPTITNIGTSALIFNRNSLVRAHLPNLGRMVFVLTVP